MCRRHLVVFIVTFLIYSAEANTGIAAPVYGELVLMRRLVFGTGHDSVAANDKI
jgi:hypothetical protein